jgi:hypothetical protein
MEDVFVPYLDADRYVQKEKQSLMEVCSLLLGFINVANIPVIYMINFNGEIADPFL